MKREQSVSKPSLFCLNSLDNWSSNTEYVFVLIVCQNNTSTLRLLGASHALSSLENHSIIEETQLWKVNGHFRILFSYLECMVRELMRPSFASSFI